MKDPASWSKRNQSTEKESNRDQQAVPVASSQFPGGLASQESLSLGPSSDLSALIPSLVLAWVTFRGTSFFHPKELRLELSDIQPNTWFCAFAHILCFLEESCLCVNYLPIFGKINALLYSTAPQAGPYLSPYLRTLLIPCYCNIFCTVL